MNNIKFTKEQEKKFVREAMEEIADQDRENENKPVSTVMEDLIAVMRLVSDNHEMIQLIQSGKIATVSELALALNRELSNVSRTLSRMAAYGLIGYEGAVDDARAKKPVWLFSSLPGHEDLDWIQAYCLTMALKKMSSVSLLDSNFLKIEKAVRVAFISAAKKIKLVRSPAH